MKTIVVIASILILTFPLYAQTEEVSDNDLYAPREVRCKKVTGTGDYLITYRFSFPLDTVSGRIYEDMMVLQIGSEISHYYSWNSDVCDSIAYKSTLSGAESAQYPRYWLKPNQRATPDDIYWNYPSKGTLLNQFRIFTTEYLCSEPLPVQQWSIRQDLPSEILGYICASANTIFRGREYTAYFTTDIPLHLGPWKFSGLPGLILKVEEASSLFKWEAVGIEKRPTDIYIYDAQKMKTISSIFPMRTKSATREQAAKLREKLWSDPLGLLQQHGQAFGGPLSEHKREAARKQYAPPLELE